KSQKQQNKEEEEKEEEEKEEVERQKKKKNNNRNFTVGSTVTSNLIISLVRFEIPHQLRSIPSYLYIFTTIWYTSHIKHFEDRGILTTRVNFCFLLSFFDL
ncbi:hypothetical protein PP707_06640, partial [Acetobacter pasteurianus]|nr:hypothetical protein [Acetobacter pasteurianus]